MRMLALGWRYRASCILVLIEQLLLVAVQLAALGLTGFGIDYIRSAVDSSAGPVAWPLGIAPPQTWTPLSVVAAIAGTIFVAALLHTFLRNRAAVHVGDLTQRIVVQLRSDVYNKLQRLSFRFYDARQSGTIINRVTGDVQAVRLFVDGVMIQALVTGMTLLVFLAYMLSVHVPLTIACLASTPLLWFASVRFSRSVRPVYQQNRELSDKLVLALSENVQGVHVVKGFNREPEEIAKFVAANERIRESKYRVFHRLSTFQPAIGFLTQLNLLILLGYGGALVMQGELLLGEGMFVFANLLNLFATQVGQLANISNSIQSSITGAERVFEVLDAPVEIATADDAVRLPNARGHVRFESVSFAYHTETPVLDRIDFEAVPGECIAITGPTGAGKSSLISLLPRFYDPQQGRVLIDCEDVRRVHLDDLRRTMTTCDVRSASSFRKAFCSATPWRQTSHSAAPTPRANKWCVPRKPPRRMNSSHSSRTGTTRSSASTVQICRAGSGNASPSRAPFCSIRRF
jgi:ATP-binding cassette subfamily B protein